MERSELQKKKLNLNYYNKPIVCKSCGGRMIYKGVGEYACEDCGQIDYDDYGKARNYIEKHKGANISDVARGTGVSQKAIRQMLKESRLEVTENSKTFLVCEICGAAIRSGRFCPKCEGIYRRQIEEEAKEERSKHAKISGHSIGSETSSGERRFKRDDEE